MAATPLRNIRSGDDVWHDALLVTKELGTNNSAVCNEALRKVVADHPTELRRAKRRLAAEQRQSGSQ